MFEKWVTATNDTLKHVSANKTLLHKIQKMHGRCTLTLPLISAIFFFFFKSRNVMRKKHIVYEQAKQKKIHANDFFNFITSTCNPRQGD